MFEIIAITVASLFALLLLFLNVLFLFFVNRKITIFTRQYLEYSKINMGAVIEQFSKVIRAIDLEQPETGAPRGKYDDDTDGQLLKRYQELVNNRGKK